jgi:hypothetical protein
MIWRIIGGVIGFWLLIILAAEACAQFAAGPITIGAVMAGAPATVPQLYVAYALPGDTARRPAATIVVDKPLKLSRDAAGVMHLGADLPLVGILASGCTQNNDGSLTCPKVSFSQ